MYIFDNVLRVRNPKLKNLVGGCTYIYILYMLNPGSFWGVARNSTGYLMILRRVNRSISIYISSLDKKYTT